MFRRRKADPLEQATVPWLLACALATTAPHAGHLPLWLAAVAASALFLRGGLWFAGKSLPPRWLLGLLVVAGTVGIWLEYRTIFGRDAGVALLVLFMALKPLEMQARRDAVVLVMLGLFLLLTHYFYSQSIPTGLWLMSTVLLETATMIRIFGGDQAPARIVRRAGVLLLQATPIMLVLFVLFPRINGPLWGLPQDALSSRTGLPSTISAGSIAELVRDGSIAFRARFAGPPPANNELYWRGPVMDEYDGREWRPSPDARFAQRPRQIEIQGTPVDYELTLEAHHQRWLLALDIPASLPAGVTLTHRLQAVTRDPVHQRSRFELRAATRYRFGIDETPEELAPMQRLPRHGNARARALAAEWRAKHGDARAIAVEALRLFRNEPFVYTLRPPLLGNDPVDDFLFRTRRGFCEHYASAFVFLMRAAGVPARIVAGYQGGETNPVDGYVVVRQSDAHAWAEIWTADNGWQRFDPTAAVAPSRVETGIADALPIGEPLPILTRIDLDWLRQMRFRWEAVNNRWNQWVLGYNPERQRALLQGLGLGDIDWRGMVALLATLCGTILLAIVAWAIWHRPRQDAAQRLWQRFCQRLARRGASRHPWEGPLEYAERVARDHPELAKAARAGATAYAAARYGRDPQALAGLRAALAAATDLLPH